ncbi:hypothetical protein FCL40_02050 [Ferrimonas sediminicola]|uniref:Uncharacterized protein n=1 Tax=Ferrimonas sediminicola TaxID=2569538 RepID=A0A4U1BJ25_9GAMM|nr:hypothetical protein [Ferrimonas sediminicola]TKB51363.1 hypothetical protein FCL40_02050 [Ferrimonas sediminicola]
MVLWVLALSLAGPAHAVYHFEAHQDLVNCAWCFHGDHQGKALTPSVPLALQPSVQPQSLPVDTCKPKAGPQRRSVIRAPPIS